jgi:hypothetical protein
MNTYNYEDMLNVPHSVTWITFSFIASRRALLFHRATEPHKSISRPHLECEGLLLPGREVLFGVKAFVKLIHSILYTIT